MLWDKETDADDALYIDILIDRKHPAANFRIHRRKNNRQSLRMRTEGNGKYAEGDFEAAMDLYNQSICFAENDSEHLGLGYANRSSCFMKLKMYDRCLVDIQLAKASHYPPRLMKKLNDRDKECTNRQKATTALIVPKPMLSFEANERLPHMANALDIEVNDQFGRLIRANRDIEIGETILLEQAYISIVYGEEANRCTTCTNEKRNFIPCRSCGDAMFCDARCVRNNFHADECGMMLSSGDCCNGESLTFLLRSIVIAINTFPTVDALIEFVDECRRSDPLEIPQSLDTDILKYRTFFKLASAIKTRNVPDYVKHTGYVFNAIMGSKLAKKFTAKATQRFLMHLIVHHCLVIRLNSFSGYTEAVNGTFGQPAVADDDKQQFQKELFLLSSHFNHACIPNVIKLGQGNLAVCKAFLPIKKGEQLFITYIADEAFGMTDKEKQDKFEHMYGFRCKCNFCQKGPCRGDQMQADEDFHYIALSLPRLVERYDVGLVYRIKNRCIKFLQKYHPHQTSSKEVAFVLTNLGAMLEKELNGR